MKEEGEKEEDRAETLTLDISFLCFNYIIQLRNNEFKDPVSQYKILLVFEYECGPLYSASP